MGPTGGGKTTVRRILERALTLLPIEELLLTEPWHSISQVHVLQHIRISLLVEIVFYASVTASCSLHVSCSVLIKFTGRNFVFRESFVVNGIAFHLNLKLVVAGVK